MKIALVHGTLPNPTRRKDGGVTYWVHRLGNHLVAAGHEVTCFAADPRPADALYEVRPLPAPRWATGTHLGRLLALSLYLNRIPSREFDVVHTHGDDTFFLARNRVRSFYGSALGEMLSATRWRRRVSTAATYPFELLSAVLAPAAIVHSETTRRHFPFVRHRVDFAVDGDVYHPGPKSPHPTILFVGTLEGRKRGQFLIDQFRQVVRPRVPSAELWVAADRSVSGPGILDLGRVPTDEALAALYRAAWVFCIPSTYEGIGLTYLEAMASGTAPVLTPNEAALEALGTPPAGVLPLDGELGEALVNLLGDVQRREELEVAAVRRAAHFNWARTIDELVEVYQRVAPRRAVA